LGCGFGCGSCYDQVWVALVSDFPAKLEVIRTYRMVLPAENRIRHIPVINDKEMIGMVSIGDVVRAVVTEYRDELDRLNAYIQGGY